MKFRAISDDRRKLNLNWDSINAYVSRWKPGTSFEIEIVKRQPKVSDPARKYYFSTVLPPFMEALGYDPEEQDLVHRQLKIVFFRIEPDKRGIYREKDVPSVFSNNPTATPDQRQKFLDWVLRKAAEEGVYVPNPGEA